MEDKDINVLGITLEGDVVADLLSKIVRIFSGPEARDFLRLLAYEPIDLRHILENRIPAPGEIEKFEEKIRMLINDAKTKQMNADKYYREKRKLAQDNIKLAEKARLATQELDNYISALRYYEDNLASMGLRQEIIPREDFEEVFSDEEDEGWTT